MTAAEFYDEAQAGDYVELSWTHEKIPPARGVVRGVMLAAANGTFDVTVVLNQDHARFRLPESGTARILQRAADRRAGFGFKRR